MKKLYRKGTVHPSPPIISDHLSFLPATILTLTVALSPDDKEILAYLISCSFSNTIPNFPGNYQRRSTSHRNGAVKASSSASHGGSSADHPPIFNCNCFRCYTSYWVRWDESPSRQLIHEIIDAFEDWLAQNSKGGSAENGKINNRKEKKNKRGSNNTHKNNNRSDFMSSGKEDSERVGEREEISSSSGDTENGGGGIGNSGIEVDEEKGSVRRIVSFIGERIWGVWSQ